MPNKLTSPYRTLLGMGDALKFEAFKKANNIPDDPSFDSSYNMPGFFKESGGLVQRLLGNSSNTEMMPDGLHFTDKFKTPFHPTFSNESQYKFPGMNREWVPTGDGTFRLIDNETGKVIRDEKAAFAFPGLLRG